MLVWFKHHSLSIALLCLSFALVVPAFIFLDDGKWFGLIAGAGCSFLTNAIQGFMQGRLNEINKAEEIIDNVSSGSS